MIFTPPLGCGLRKPMAVHIVYSPVTIDNIIKVLQLFTINATFYIIKKLS